MIPEHAITHWRNVAPWPQDAQVEQDLILSRALVEIYQEPSLSNALLLRGGTALHKPFISPVQRKGRDLFDIWTGLGTRRVDPRRIVEAFRAYMKAEGADVSRTVFEKNLAAKVGSRPFNDDLRPLLAPAVQYDAPSAARVVSEQLLALL